MSEFNQAFSDGLRPDPLLTISEWADANRILNQKASAEPGPWRTECTPYLREVMDSLGITAPNQLSTLMAGAQLGKTEGGNNWLGYVIDHAPGPMLAVQPTVELAKRNSKGRIDPLIESCPSLKAKVMERQPGEPSHPRDCSAQGIPWWRPGDDRCQQRRRVALDASPLLVPG